MVNQNKICSFKIKRQAKTVFLSDVEKTVEERTFYFLTNLDLKIGDFTINQLVYLHISL